MLMVLIVNIVSRRSFRRLLIRCLAPFPRASPRPASLTFSWNANSESDIAGYRVHYGTVAAPYSMTADVGTTTATIDQLENGVTYTFRGHRLQHRRGRKRVFIFPFPIRWARRSSSLQPPPNISTRTQAGIGEDLLIGGFIIDGVVAKKVALRAIGPSLSAFGIDGAMNDPALM